jgi:hypothetical protein
MMKKYDKIVIFAPIGSYWYCFPFIEALKDAFLQLNYDTQFLDNIDYRFEAGVETLLIVIANPEDKNTKEIGKINNQKNITTVIFETEARILKDKSEVEKKYSVYNLDFIWTYTHLNIDTIQDKIDVPVIHFAPGYSKIYDYRYHNLYRTEYFKEPITFLHNNNEKRLKILKRYMPNIKNIDNCFTFDDYAFNITKYPILINLHQEPAPGESKQERSRKGLETLRLAPFLSSGIYVISDHSYPKDENKYKDLVTFLDISEMKDYIDILLRDEEKLIRKSKLRSDIFRKDLEIKSLLKNVLNEMDKY